MMRLASIEETLAVKLKPLQGLLKKLLEVARDQCRLKVTSNWNDVLRCTQLSEIAMKKMLDEFAVDDDEESADDDSSSSESD